MKYPNVTELYHYKGLQDAQRLLKDFKGNFIGNKFWASKPASFNDPYDCRGGFGFAKNVSLLDYFHIMGSEIGKKERIRLQAEINNVGVICFSEKANNILMWSHYADKHRGCCIKFWREENNCLGNKCCVPVHYSDMISEIPYDNYRKADEDERFNMLVENYSVKAADWFYEREWRYFVKGGDEYTEFNARIGAIIFGALVTDETMDRFVAEMPISIDCIYKAELKDKYQIELKDIRKEILQRIGRYIPQPNPFDPTQTI